jgi:hypothetical protein
MTSRPLVNANPYFSNISAVHTVRDDPISTLESLEQRCVSRAEAEKVITERLLASVELLLLQAGPLSAFRDSINRSGTAGIVFEIAKAWNDDSTAATAKVDNGCIADNVD